MTLLAYSRCQDASERALASDLATLVHCFAFGARVLGGR